MIFWRIFFVLTFLATVLSLSDDCKSGLSASVLAELISAEEQWKEELKCESTIDGGKWILFQQNILQNSDLFTGGTWKSYSEGFHQKPDVQQRGVFWLGLNRLASITANTDKWQLLIKVRWYESSGNVSASTEGWAIWQDFRVENEGFKLRLGKMTKYSNIPSHPKGTDKDTKMSEDGKIFDPLAVHRDMMFSAPDRDNDAAKTFSCAKSFRSGWWFNSCYNLDLNRDPPAWFDGKNVHFPKETIMAIRLKPEK